MTNEADGFVANGIENDKKSVLICDTQPVAVEGMRWLIENSGDLRFAGSVGSLPAVFEALNPEAAKAERAAARAAAELAAEAEASAKEALATLQAETSAVTLLENPLNVGELPEATVAEAIPVETDCVACAEELPAVLETASDVLNESEVEIQAEPELISIAGPIDAVVIDKGIGMPGVMELLQKLTSTSHPTPAVVWGASVSEAEALRLLQAGARGILRRTSESGTLLTCLRAVTAGGTWMEDGIFGSAEKLFNPKRSELTQREREVVLLVEKGLRNRDIARMLGIQIGTVKIHLKHIFEKTGVRGRYGLAYTGLQNKGSIPQTTPNHFNA